MSLIGKIYKIYTFVGIFHVQKDFCNSNIDLFCEFIYISAEVKVRKYLQKEPSKNRKILFFEHHFRII